MSSDINACLGKSPHEGFREMTDVSVKRQGKAFSAVGL